MKQNTSWANRLCCIGLAASMVVVAGVGPVFAAPPNRHDYRGDYRDSPRDEQGDRDVRRDRDDRGDVRKDRDDRRDVRRDRDSRPVIRKDRDDRRERDVRRDYRYQPRVYRNETRDRGYDRNIWERRNVPEVRYRDHRRPPKYIYRGKYYTPPKDRVRWYRDVVIVRPFGHWYPGYAHYYRDDDAYKWLAFTAITLGLLNYLDEAQERELEAAQVAATTAPIGEAITWKQGNAKGQVVATREGTSVSGRYCREFQQQVSIGGKTEQAYGTACRNPDGSWEVVPGNDY